MERRGRRLPWKEEQGGGPQIFGMEKRTRRTEARSRTQGDALCPQLHSLQLIRRLLPTLIGQPPRRAVRKIDRWGGVARRKGPIDRSIDRADYSWRVHQLDDPEDSPPPPLETTRTRSLHWDVWLGKATRATREADADGGGGGRGLSPITRKGCPRPPPPALDALPTD